MKNSEIKINQILFVVAALMCFVVLGAFYLAIKINAGFKAPSVSGNFEERYYFNSNIEEADPLITKIPDLEDMLAGPIVDFKDPFRGNRSAPVTAVLFSDFTCTYCMELEQMVKDIMREYTDKILLVWKDYPELRLESDSYRAAMAGRCAQSQQAFWSYHDRLFESRDFSDENFLTLAGKLGLDKEKFKDCLRSGAPKQIINDNIMEADALGITGVPSVFVNDKQLGGKITSEELEGIILDKID